MSSPAPTARDNLRSTPLINIVVYALEQRLTGSLVLEEPNHQKHAVYFDEGAPGKVRLATDAQRLGEVLVDLGHLAEEEREPSFEKARSSGQLFGTWLVEAGMLSTTALQEALREQLVRQLLLLAELPGETVFGYYDGVNFLENWGSSSVRTKPLALVWRLVQRHASVTNVRYVLASLGDRPLRLHHEAPVQRFYFGPRERAVIDVLRAKPQPVSELRARELVEPELLDRLLYALAITRQLQNPDSQLGPLGVDEAPSSSRIPLGPKFTPPGGITASGVSGVGPIPTSPITGSPASRPASSAETTSSPRTSSSARFRRPTESPEVKAFKAEIRERAGRIHETFYDVLGVAQDAPANVISTAFHTLAKRWHPDRLGPDYADVYELATRVFARMSEAHSVLTDTTARREYNIKLRKAGSAEQEQRQVERILRAATEFQKAEVFLKRNKLAEAEAHAKAALADDPDNADHIALVTWIASLQPDANLPMLIRDLDRALHLQPNSVRAHWYRGQLYKRMGKDSKAIQDFRAVRERDPRHVDAEREIRLYQMRRGSQGGLSATPNPTSRPPGTLPPGSIRPSLTPHSSARPGKPEGGGLLRKIFKPR